MLATASAIGFAGGRLDLLTTDRSEVEDQVRAGPITAEEARHSPLRHVITQAIGSRRQVEPDVQTIKGHSGDLLFLASDGLNRELEDTEIEGC